MQDRNGQRCEKLQQLVEYRSRIDQLERELGLEPTADEVFEDRDEEPGAAPPKEAAREALIVAERIAAMSNVARAIAHEINNPLATCMGYLRRAKQLADDLDSRELEEVLDSISHSAARIQGIIGELQMLSEEFVCERERLDLASVVERVGRLIAPEFRPQIDYRLETAEVYLDRPRLYQLVYNAIMSHLLSGRDTDRDESVVVRCGPHSDRGAELVVESDAIPRMGMRVDLLAALRGEEPTSTIPLRLAHRLAIEMGARWHEEAIDGERYRTGVVFEPP
ncbi:MAG: histidine kinase dimerization/phospho-acceptor domain-containing protein [Persicimonas sp.]